MRYNKIESFVMKEGANKTIPKRGETVKTIVIYKSKTGYTKQYAKWIAAELSADFTKKKALQDLIQAAETPF
jgi:hypothetical protein